MGFMDTLKGMRNKVRFADAEERKMYEALLEKERGKAAETASMKRKEELMEMARMEALPREERLAMKLQKAKSGAERLYKGAKSANEKAKKFNKKLGFDSGLIGQSMKGGAGGQLSNAMRGSASTTKEKLRKTQKGRKITITFDR